MASAYQASGAWLGWLLISHQQAVEVWHSNGGRQRLEGLAVLEAGHEAPNLQLQPTPFWKSN